MLISQHFFHEGFTISPIIRIFILNVFFKVKNKVNRSKDCMNYEVTHLPGEREREIILSCGKAMGKTSTQI